MLTQAVFQRQILTQALTCYHDFALLAHGDKIMLMAKKSEQSGIIIVALLLIAALMIFGYVVINSVSKSREADQIKDTATDAIEAAKDSVDAVNKAKDQAEELIGN